MFEKKRSAKRAAATAVLAMALGMTTGLRAQVTPCAGFTVDQLAFGIADTANFACGRPNGNIIVTAANSIQYEFPACPKGVGCTPGLPYNASSYVVNSQGYHTLIWGKTFMFATNNGCGGCVQRVDPVTLNPIATLWSFGSTVDGLTYNPDPTDDALYVVNWFTGIWRIPSPDTCTPPCTPTLVVDFNNATDFPGGSFRGDHIAVSWNANFLFFPAYSQSPSFKVTLPPPGIGTGGVCNMDPGGLMGGGANDGVASLIENTSFPNKHEVFWNNNNGTVYFMNNDQPCPAQTIACAAQNQNFGDGIGAPGDPFLYLCSNGEIWRLDPPVTEDIFLAGGGSPQANLLIALYAIQDKHCVRPEGLAKSLTSRMNLVISLINKGEYAQAKRRMQEISASVRGIEHHQEVCPGVLNNLVALVDSVINGLP